MLELLKLQATQVMAEGEIACHLLKRTSLDDVDTYFVMIQHDTFSWVHYPVLLDRAHEETDHHQLSAQVPMIDQSLVAILALSFFYFYMLCYPSMYM